MGSGKLQMRPPELPGNTISSDLVAKQDEAANKINFS
jgi:hypothetical protein